MEVVDGELVLVDVVVVLALSVEQVFYVVVLILVASFSMAASVGPSVGGGCVCEICVFVFRVRFSEEIFEMFVGGDVEDFRCEGSCVESCARGCIVVLEIGFGIGGVIFLKIYIENRSVG